MECAKLCCKAGETRAAAAYVLELAEDAIWFCGDEKLVGKDLYAKLCWGVEHSDIWFEVKSDWETEEEDSAVEKPRVLPVPVAKTLRSALCPEWSGGAQEAVVVGVVGMGEPTPTVNLVGVRDRSATEP